MSEWDFLSDIADELDVGSVHDLPYGVATAICDGVIAALCSEERADLERAQSELTSFYLDRLAKAPPSAAVVARGDGNPSSPEAAAFALGQIGLAQATVALAASKRADGRFERLLLSKPLERYVRLLLGAELSGRELADALEKDEAEVSRRLKVLRQIGAVECRREGNRIVNFLTPAARMVAKARNMGTIGTLVAQNALSPEVVSALNEHRLGYPPELRNALLFVGYNSQRLRR